jgi:hypothetical protein
MFDFEQSVDSPSSNKDPYVMSRRLDGGRRDHDDGTNENSGSSSNAI